MGYIIKILEEKCWYKNTKTIRCFLFLTKYKSEWKTKRDVYPEDSSNT